MKKTYLNSFSQRAWAWGVSTLFLNAFLSAQTVRSYTPAEKDAFNLSVILAAQNKLQPLLANAKDDYSIDLETLQTKLNGYLARNEPDLYSGIKILDPIKADVGAALYVTPEMIVRTLLLQQALHPYKSLSRTAAEYLFSDSGTETGFTQNPRALFLFGNSGATNPCIIIPAPIRNVPAKLNIPGMTTRQTADFSNRHEGWHCLDKVYYNKYFPAYVFGSNFDPAKPDTLIGNHDGLLAFSMQHQAEAFADVAAAGDLIHEGGSVDLIDKIADWRDDTEELTHMTAPALRGLKNDIAAMGLTAFRDMNENQLRDFYYAVIEKYALNNTRLEIRLRYDAANAQDRADYIEKSADNPEIKKALAFYAKPLSTKGIASAFTKIFAVSKLDEKQIKRDTFIKNQVEPWKPMQELEDRAFNAEGKVTPETLMHAYIKLQDEFMRATDNDAGNADLYAAKATRLKAAFTTEVLDLDYVTVNQHYGVALSRIAPSPT